METRGCGTASSAHSTRSHSTRSSHLDATSDLDAISDLDRSSRALVLLSFGQSYTATEPKTQKTHFPPCRFLNVAPPTFARCPESNSKKQAWNDRKRLLLSALGTVARSHHGVNTEAEQEANQEAEQGANQVADQEANQEAEQEAIHRFTAELELSELAIRSFPKVFYFSIQTPISPICRTPLFPISQNLILCPSQRHTSRGRTAVGSSGNSSTVSPALPGRRRRSWRHRSWPRVNSVRMLTRPSAPTFMPRATWPHAYASLWGPRKPFGTGD